MSKSLQSKQALEAMRRAAEIARVRAARMGTRLAYWKEGEVVLVDPASMTDSPLNRLQEEPES